MEQQKLGLRQRMFNVDDGIMAKRDELIDRLEKRMRQRTAMKPMLTIRWSVV